MHTFNRFLVILLCLSGVVFWSLLLLLVWFAPTEFGGALGQVGRLLRLQPVLLQVLVSGFGVSSMLVALLILAGEFTAQTAGTVVVRGGGGMARVSIEAIAGHLRSALENSAGVVHLRPLVRRVGNSSVAVQLEVEAAGNAPLPALAEALAKTVKDEVETGLGVGLRAVNVNFMDTDGFRTDGSNRLPSMGDQHVTVPATPIAPAPSEQP